MRGCSPVVTCLLLFATTLCLVNLGSVNSKDPYKVLGVSKDSDEATIKKAYKKLALKYHPDKNPKGQSRFIELQQAYEILSDADKKRQYDLAGSYDGAGEHHHHQGSWHHQQRHQQQRQYQYHHYHQQQQHYQQQQEQMHDRALPSDTSFLTTSNFRNLVFYGSRPWLMMIYLEDSVACREFSPSWEALWQSLGGNQPGAGNRDGASVGLGRVHARFQRSLVHWLLKSVTSRALDERDLPYFIGVPNFCTDVSCFKRYRGPLRLSALQDFVADQLLQLPKVPQLEPPGVPSFLRQASPYKVVVIAFGRGGGSGSLTLRSLAARHKDMLTVVRGHVQEDNRASAVAWQAALGLSSPPASGTVVFLRGPGTAPRVLMVPSGKVGDLPQQIDEQGLLWQEVPPLRPNTGASLGCLWGRAAAASGRPMIETCVIAVSPRGSILEETRRRMVALGQYLAMAGAQRDPSLSAAAGAYMAGRLRLAWLDAEAQRQLCSWMLGTPPAMRPTNTAPPPGTNAAGRAAAMAQAKAAAAAKSPQLVRSVCGSAPLDILGRARELAAAAAGAVRLRTIATQLRPGPTARLLIFRPSVDGSSWVRGGHMRNGRHTFLFAVNADFDLGSPDRSVDADLPKLAIWINQMHISPDRQLHASTTFPSDLLKDDEPSAFEYVRSRLSEMGSLLLGFLLTATGMDDVLPGGSTMQVVNVLVLVAIILVLQLALWWRGDGPTAGRARTTTAAGPVSAAVAAQPASPIECRSPESKARGPQRRSRGSFGSGRDSVVEADDHSEDGLRRRRERAEPRNRRAMSPSWLRGRRGDAADGDGELAGRAQGGEEALQAEEANRLAAPHCGGVLHGHAEANGRDLARDGEGGALPREERLSDGSAGGDAGVSEGDIGEAATDTAEACGRGDCGVSSAPHDGAGAAGDGGASRSSSDIQAPESGARRRGASSRGASRCMSTGGECQHAGLGTKPSLHGTEGLETTDAGTEDGWLKVGVMPADKVAQR